MLSYLLLALPMASLAAAPKARPAAAAVPAAPAKPATPNAGAPRAEGIISSEVNGRDLVFIANALDLGKALEYLSAEATNSQTTGFKGLANSLAANLSATTAVASSVAEMHSMKAPTESPTQKRLAEKLEKLSGPKREKVLLEMFIEIDERMLATYELGRASTDPTILKLSKDALPQTQEHLYSVQRLAGIAPKQAAQTTAPASTKSVALVPPAEPKGERTDGPVTEDKPAPKSAPEKGEPKPEPVAKAEAPEKKAEVKSEPPPPPAPKPAPVVAKEANAAPPAPAKPAPAVAETTLPPKPKTEPAPAPAPAPAKPVVAEAPKVKPTAAPKPAPIAEAPAEDVAPKKLEADPKSPKRPSFRMNVKPPTE